MKIEILGAHRSNFRDCQYISILIDDILALDAGCLAARLTSSQQRNVKAILLSHLHYDHVRDIPAIAINNYLSGLKVKAYMTQHTCRGLTKYLLNGDVYPKFYNMPPSAPAIELCVISPGTHYKILDYDVIALSAKHMAGAVSYYLVDNKEKSIFFTGDTAPGFGQHLYGKFPSLLISEVTFPNGAEEHALFTNHLTPKLLKEELSRILQNNGNMPPVLVLHMDPESESEIRAELNEVSCELNMKIGVAEEGLLIYL